jgi:hypothetical protein
MDRIWRIVVGAHPIEAIANHASNNSLTDERTPTARTARAEATISASSRSASARLARIVTDRSTRRPVSGSVPMNTRSSHEPALR